jgi:F0F1-type ATP synthase assembly protein I
MLLRVGTPNRIHWKAFFRIAIPLTAVVGLFTAANPGLAWLLVLPASVVLAIHLYRRRQPGPLKPSQGAQMGALIGLCTFVLFAVLMAARVASDPAEYRHLMAQALQEAMARNPDPAGQQMMQSFFGGTGGLVIVTAVCLVFALALLLAIGSVSGVLAARFSRGKNS